MATTSLPVARGAGRSRRRGRGRAPRRGSRRAAVAGEAGAAEHRLLRDGVAPDTGNRLGTAQPDARCRVGPVRKGRQRRNRVARSIPTAVPEDPAVGFVWPDAEAPSHALWRLVESIGWLGSSRSPVACAVTAEAPTGYLPSRRARRVAGTCRGEGLDRRASQGSLHPPAAGQAAGHGLPTTWCAPRRATGDCLSTVLRRCSCAA